MPVDESKLTPVEQAAIRVVRTPLDGTLLYSPLMRAVIHLATTLVGAKLIDTSDTETNPATYANQRISADVVVLDYTRQPKCWRLDANGELKQDVSLLDGMDVYAIRRSPDGKKKYVDPQIRVFTMGEAWEVVDPEVNGMAGTGEFIGADYLYTSHEAAVKAMRDDPKLGITERPEEPTYEELKKMLIDLREAVDRFPWGVDPKYLAAMTACKDVK